MTQTIHTILDSLRDEVTSNRALGDRFERLIRRYLDPITSQATPNSAASSMVEAFSAGGYCVPEAIGRSSSASSRNRRRIFTRCFLLRSSLSIVWFADVVSPSSPPSSSTL